MIKDHLKITKNVNTIIKQLILNDNSSLKLLILFYKLFKTNLIVLHQLKTNTLERFVGKCTCTCLCLYCQDVENSTYLLRMCNGLYLGGGGQKKGPKSALCCYVNCYVNFYNVHNIAGNLNNEILYNFARFFFFFTEYVT